MDDEELGELTAPLLADGRHVTVEFPSVNQSIRLPAYWDPDAEAAAPDGPRYAQFWSVMWQICLSEFTPTPSVRAWTPEYCQEVNTRMPFQTPILAPGAGHSDMFAFRDLCLGHKAMEIASSVNGLNLWRVGPTSAWTLSPELPPPPEDPSQPTPVSAHFPISDPSDAASWALFAADRFRDAAAYFTQALSSCSGGAVTLDTVPPGETGGQKYGSILATGLADAMTSMMEAAELAEKRVLAASQAKQGNTKQETAEAVTRAWRDRHDSRLEVATIYGPIDGRRFEPGLDAGVDAPPESERFPVVATGPAGEGEARAEEIIRSTRANPCLTGMGSWCDEALAGLGTRQVADLALDILRSMQLRGGNVADMPSSSPSALALLQKNGVSLAELEQAARRVVEHARVLGQAIVPDTEIPDAGADSGVAAPSLVLGTAVNGAKASPHYLYASTVGSTPWHLVDLDSPEDTFNHVSSIFGFPADPATSLNDFISYSSHSITGTAWQVGAWADAYMTANAASSAEYLDIVGEVRAYARQVASAATLLAAGRSSNSTTSVSIMHLGPIFPGATTASVNQRCSMWVGEAGLECGLTGKINGGTCVPSRYRVALSSTAWSVDTTMTGVDITFDKMPIRPWVNGGEGGFGLKERFYGICEVDDRKQVSIAVELAEFPEWADSGAVAALLPPMSQATLDGLSRTLAADSARPYQGALSCAGVPYNVKLALEDEITEAFTGQDGIESSFAYYLKLARQAADRADGLGDQLIEQGLQMDLRAEAAREKLEDLCGGIVDVSKLEAAACSNPNYKCDILAMLVATANQSSNGALGISDSELSGVRSCLGIGGGGKPVWAALGDQTLCIPQFYPAPGNPMPPPGVCPAELCTQGTTTVRPAVLTCGSSTNDCTCASMYNLPEYAEGVRPEMAGIGVRTVSDRLNLFITAVDTKDLPSTFGGSQQGGSGAAPLTPTSHPCQQMASLRSYLAVTEYLRRNPAEATGLAVAGLPAELPEPDWANLLQVRRVADAVGFTQDVYGVPAVTLGGRPWVTIGSAASGYNSQPNEWPCARMPWVSEQQCSNTSNGLGIETPLACGFICNRNYASQNTRRLKAAVQTLKGITGTSFDNVFSASQRLGDGLIPFEGVYNSGSLPGWFNLGATDHWLSEDGSIMWYADPQLGRTVKMAVIQVPEPVLTTAQPNPNPDDWAFTTGPTGGFIDPNHLWNPYDQGCKDGNPNARVLGCGQVRQLLRGHWVQPVRSEIAVDKMCPVPVHDWLVVQWDYCAKNNGADQVACMREHEYSMLYDPKADLKGDFTDEGKKQFAVSKPSAIKYDDGCKCEIMPKTISLTQGQLGQQFQVDPAQESWKTTKPSAYKLVSWLQCGPATTGSALSANAVLDGLELACMAQKSGAANCESVLRTPLKIESIEDFPKVRARVECAARGAQSSLDRMFIADVPKDVVDALGSNGSGRLESFPGFRGDYGRVVAELGAKLIALRAQADTIVQKYRDVGSMFEMSRIQSQITDLNIASGTIDAAITAGDQKINDLEMAKKKLRTRQAISTSITECINAMIPESWTGFITGDAYAGLAKGANTCANSALQIASEQKIQGLDQKITAIEAQKFDNLIKKIQLGQEISEYERELMFNKLAIDIAAKVDEIQLAGAKMAEIQADVHASLSQLDSIRNQARREAAKVLMLSNDDVGRSYGVNTVMRARMNTLRVRYEAARDDAIRLSFMARRAVEQRFGVDLSLMEDDMTLVRAPRTWVDTLCTSTAIDYAKIRTGEGASDPTGKDLSYAGSYVGDWLTNLEGFVESYRVDNPFQDGDDIAVISLRDEIMRAKQECELPGWNQLYYTDGTGGQLMSAGEVADPYTDIRSTRTVWEQPCLQGEQVVVRPTESESPFTCQSPELANCRALGDSRAVRLSLSDETCVASAGVSPGGQLPQANMVYHYEGSGCVGNAAIDQVVCQDMSPANNDAVLRDGAATITTGPLGLPLLQTTQESTLISATAVAATSDYTYSYVMRRTGTAGVDFGGSFLHAYGQDLMSLTHNENEESDWVELYGENWSGSPARGYHARATAPGTRTRIRNGTPEPRVDIYTVRAGAGQGGELYVNGVLRARIIGDPLPATLDRVLNFFGGSSGGSVAMGAAVAYRARLSDQDLRALHAYLSARFDVPLNEPIHWISGDMLAQVRATGASAISGHAFGSPRMDLFDAANGSAPLGAEGDVDQVPLTTLGGHSAVAFDGSNDDLWYAEFAQQGEYPGGEYESHPTDVNKEYSVTLVARCDAVDNRDQNLFWTWVPPLGESRDWDNDYIRVGVQGGTGRVRLENKQTQQVFLSGQDGDASCGAPFVLTLRASVSAGNTTDVFVNGRRVLHHGQFWPVQLAATYGDEGGFAGAIAESMIHAQAMSDADVVALHEQLGAKYDIEVAVPSGSGPILSGPARIVQRRVLSAGEYWVSWHQRADQPRLGLRVDLPGGNEPVSVAPATPMTVTNTVWPTGAGITGRPDNAMLDSWLSSTWVRHVEKVTVPVAGEVSVGFVLPANSTAQFAFAAPQVERIDSNISERPKDYFPTSSKLTAAVAHCEDKDGAKFRTMWARGCEYYCPPGQGTDCASDGEALGLPKRCYYELKFPVSLEAIEKGDLIPAAGFARGNFNYRFDQLAMNFVGTAAKDCERSGLRSSCYGSNFLQYSLQHGAPYRIRNHEGDVVDAPLFVGSVQQAKGLLAERYITNPLASSDDSLLRDYWRQEFRGRPIDGNFALRVYDADGLNFDKIKDVQLLLRYRYWTRFDR